MDFKRSAALWLTVHVGSGRPEKIETPARYSALCSVDFDVPMFDHHEGTKSCVHSPVGRARVCD